MREYTDNTRIVNSESSSIRHEPEFYYKWKANFLRKCYIGRPLKIKWVKNPAPTSTKSSDIIGKNVKYIIAHITDKILVLKSENGYNISISFADIYSHNNINYIDFK